MIDESKLEEKKSRRTQSDPGTLPKPSLPNPTSLIKISWIKRLLNIFCGFNEYNDNVSAKKYSGYVFSRLFLMPLFTIGELIIARPLNKRLNRANAKVKEVFFLEMMSNIFKLLFWPDKFLQEHEKFKWPIYFFHVAIWVIIALTVITLLSQGGLALSLGFLPAVFSNMGIELFTVICTAAYVISYHLMHAIQEHVEKEFAPKPLDFTVPLREKQANLNHENIEKDEKDEKNFSIQLLEH